MNSGYEVITSRKTNATTVIYTFGEKIVPQTEVEKTELIVSSPLEMHYFLHLLVLKFKVAALNMGVNTHTQAFRK